MSGFVVAAAYEHRLTAGWSVANFARVRLKRLWPLCALGLAVGLVCYAIVRAVKPSDDFLFPPLPLAGVTAMGEAKAKVRDLAPPAADALRRSIRPSGPNSQI